MWATPVYITHDELSPWTRKHYIPSVEVNLSFIIHIKLDCSNGHYCIHLLRIICTALWPCRSWNINDMLSFQIIAGGETWDNSKYCVNEQCLADNIVNCDHAPHYVPSIIKMLLAFHNNWHLNNHKQWSLCTVTLTSVWLVADGWGCRGPNFIFRCSISTWFEVLLEMAFIRCIHSNWCSVKIELHWILLSIVFKLSVIVGNVAQPN